MLKIHLDTDLGGDMDDLCALALVLKWPAAELVGVTTVAEHKGKRAGYVRYILGLAGRPDVPVAAGADAAQGYYREWPGLPNEAAYWPEPIPAAPAPLDEALALLERSIDEGAVIAAVGPYTNLALLEKRRPGILKQAKLYLMGGYLFPPREGFPAWGNQMDYNIQVDVKSAYTVLQNSNPTLVPLSVTAETALRRAYLPALREAGTLGQLIARQAAATAEEYNNEAKFGQTCRGLPADIMNFQHDPLACAVAFGWRAGVEIQELPLQVAVENGWLVERIEPQGKPTPVVTKVDGAQFNDFWLRIVTG
jgi:inosine-uridine nucleoside N-ribohydrolase